MDFTKSISISTGTSTALALDINSITTAPSAGTPFSGYLLQGISYAAAGISGYVDARAQTDGVDTDIAVLGPRSISAVVQVYGSTIGDFMDKIDTLNSACNPYPPFAESTDGFRDLRFTQPTISYAAYSTSGIPLRFKVRPTSLPSYSLDNTLYTPQTSDRGLTTKMQLNFFAKDPRKISQTVSSSSLNISTTTTTTTSITNNGNYKSYPTMVFINSATTARTATISTTSWTSVVTLPASTTVTIDSEERTVRVGSTLRMDLIGAATTALPYLSPGTNTITISAIAATVTATYSFYEAWL